MDSANIKGGLSNENGGVSGATLKSGGGAHSAEAQGEVTPTDKRGELQVGGRPIGDDPVEGGTAKDAPLAQRQTGRTGSTHHGGSNKRESGLTDDQRTDRKKSQEQRESPTPRSDVEFHKLYESDDNNFVSPRNSSTSESEAEAGELPEPRRRRLRSYDKVSNAFIKTSKSLLKRTNNIGYAEGVEAEAAEKGRAGADGRAGAKGSSSDGADATSKVRRARARLLRSCHSGAASQTASHPVSVSGDPPLCREPDEDAFFAENFELINKTLREDHKWGEESKERMMGKCKQLLDSNETVKLYNEIDILYEERILLVKFINYYMGITEKHQRELQKIQTSYEILLTENEQLCQNNITLKRHIDLQRAGESKAEKEAENV
ncbi:hypothetical protein PVNG_01160 [Plasmodium vivax North Korean]|uniref:Uncharacterized protein n=1 Tax=Plasmodium vivax North Korean TaxID=1035514 RepID=A0A0J9TNH4_PLAVI|nr:hypothetical protein PVNG_01160 [Plasmodium vivax North Korean]